MTFQPGDQIAAIRTGVWDIDVSVDVLSDVTIRHGAEQFDVSQSRVSTAVFTVRVPEGTTNYWYLGQVGVEVRIDTAGQRRFTGHITDLSYEWEDTTEGRMLMHKATCVGLIARLGSRLITAASWPQQHTSSRVSSILTTAWTWVNETWTVQTGDYNPTKTAVEERDLTAPALDELESLQFEADAALFDDTDATVVWQNLSWRNTQRDIVEIPDTAVVFAPDFTQRLDLVNTLTLTYATGSVTTYNHESRFYLGEWAESYETDYAGQTDAQVKADRIVRRQGVPPVVMPAVDVLLNRLDPATLTAVQALRVGTKVRLPRLPDPYPIGIPVGQSSGVWIVEGWTEYVGSRYNPDDEWRLTLHLSPPIWSMVSLTWGELELSGELWQDFPDTTWDEIGEL